jgi:hypothetical protein
MKYRIAAAAFVLGLLTVSSWAATTLGRPTAGYVYFHQRGADIGRHNEAVEHCAIEAAKTMSPVIPSYSAPSTSLGNVLGNVIGGMLLGGIQDDVAHASFTANVENCMVVSGWEVVKLDDREGKALSKLDQAAQATALAPWVGAEDVHGKIMRRYEPVALTDWTTAGFGDSARDSLSLTSEASAVINRANLVPAGKSGAHAWDDGLIAILPSDPAKIPENAAVIVLTGMTPKPPNSWVDLIYLGESGEFPPGRTTYLRLGLPAKPFWESGTRTTTLAFVVPAGRWAIADISTVGFCLSTSGFTVSAGEAVFAGSFNSQALFTPDLSTDAAKIALNGTVYTDLSTETDKRLPNDTWVARNLKPAAYHSEEHFPCEKFPQTILYKLAIGSP